jgi:alginate O-acetyltransferase complex protein AlgI
MLFNSLEFLIFLPLFCALFALTSGRARLLVSLIGSYTFYGWWDWRFVGLIALLTVLHFAAGLALSAGAARGPQRRLLTLSVTFSLLTLAYFKYTDFLIESLNLALTHSGLSAPLSPLNILLPVGISFYTFQTMSYTLDVARGELPAERSLLRFAVFVSFFPQLVAGPIVRARDFLPQLHTDRPVTAAAVRVGLSEVAWGFALKILLADTLAPVADALFRDPAIKSAGAAWAGVIAYTWQIYGDFAGYSLIAIGLARLLGYEFEPNFRRPYAARSLSDFWTRWHISLSSWLRDYLYIPLGGNRGGPRQTARNLMITMLLGGLWHGAAWTFVAWGALHGAALIAQRRLAPAGDWIARLPGGGPLRDALGWLLTMGVVVVGWVLFRAQSLSDAAITLARLTDTESLTWANAGARLTLAKGAALILLFTVAEGLGARWGARGWVERDTPYAPLLTATFVALTLIAIALLGSFKSASFIYFQF